MADPNIRQPDYGKIVTRAGRAIICDPAGKALDCTRGACCGRRGECLGENLLRTECDDLQGYFFAKSNCRTKCVPQGSCCNEATSECFDEVPRWWCRREANRTGDPWVWVFGESCQSRDPPCEARGRCCNFWTGECNDDILKDVCGCRGGRWIWSAGLQCKEGEPCRPHGACCNRPSGPCAVTTQAQCDGRWVRGMPCCACSVALGSCCIGGLGCSDGVTELECALRDPGPGTWSELPCNQRQGQPDCRKNVERGACCDIGEPGQPYCGDRCSSRPGQCCDKTYEDCMCWYRGGRQICDPPTRCWNWGWFKQCDCRAHGPNLGSCCLPGGACLHTTAAACNDLRGSWAELLACAYRGRNCSITEYGSCCNAQHQICHDNVPRRECLARNIGFPCGPWSPSSIPCNRRACIEPGKGACCNHTPLGGICHCNMTEAECDQIIGRTEWHEGVQCEDIVCQSEPNWGACCNRDLNLCVDYSSGPLCEARGPGWRFHYEKKCRFLRPPCGAIVPLCKRLSSVEPDEPGGAPARRGPTAPTQEDLDALADEGLILGSDGLLYSGEVSQGKVTGPGGIDPHGGGRGCGCTGGCSGKCSEQEGTEDDKLSVQQILSICEQCPIMTKRRVLGIMSTWCGTPFVDAFRTSGGCGCNVELKSQLYVRSGRRMPGCPKGLWPGQEHSSLAVT